MDSSFAGRAILAAAVLVFALAPSLARAQIHVGAGGGVFLPYEGDPGGSVSVHAQGAFAGRHLRAGGELEYRRFDASLARDFRNVGYDAIFLRFLFHYHFLPDAVVSPYLGFGTGINVNIITNQERRGTVSGGFTTLAIAGLEAPVPGTGRLAFFTEARVGTVTDIWKKTRANWQLDQVGGFTGMAGFRWRFGGDEF